MKKESPFPRLLFRYLIITTILSGCSVVDSRISTPIPPVNKPLMATFQDYSDTPTLTRTIVTETVHQTMVPTLEGLGSIVQPSLTSDEIKTLILELMHNNGGCKLPCFWNLSPGQTSWKSLQDFIVHSGETEAAEDIVIGSHNMGNSGASTSINIFSNGTRISTSISYDQAQEKIKSIAAHFEAYQEHGTGANLQSKVVFGNSTFIQLLGYYMLPNILSIYGEPDKVLIKPILYDAPYLVQDKFSLVLFFSERGFAVEYVFPLTKNNDGYVGCPMDSGYISIITWNPEHELSLAEIARRAIGNGMNELTIEYFKSLEEATSMTLDEFSQEFKIQEENKCLNTPLTIWPH